MAQLSDENLIETIAERLAETGRTLSVAESLTCGRVASTLGSGPDTKTWLRGGVVAYQTEVKQRVLGVTPGPVVSARCAEELAVGVASLLGSDVSIATTGAGGPGPEEGEPEGTVFLGWSVDGVVGSERHDFDGEPAEILDQTVRQVLERLEQLLTAGKH
ncbi:CinA family protein [Pseudoclavibacter sp. RFBA6]|uniref:CinA family protein n=1 Tax=Pseudoclavibacter sp. RFBA6 TaxID=2080573 RepID=UPI000CE81AA7|nr:CinA family protein [Pseudoclavibacter sp. RFBA6]PPG37968.1 CinA family protein [Pseudoclavibacter sp. RFBA6]